MIAPIYDSVVATGSGPPARQTRVRIRRRCGYGGQT